MIFLRRAFFVVLTLPLAACATAKLDPGCADNAMCAARTAESRLLIAGRAERHGDDLVLRPARGDGLVFTDHKQACESDDVSNCIGFALMGHFRKSNAWVLQKFYYEGGSFVLIDDRSGRQISLTGMPVFSPDGKEFLVAPYDEENDPGPNNLEIWRRDGDGAVLEWVHTFEQALAEDPSLKMVYLTEVTGWAGNRLALRLSEPETERVWNGSLIRDATGWHLSALSPH
jgi:hypothetical protein